MPEEIRARLARPTIRLSGSVGYPMDGASPKRFDYFESNSEGMSGFWARPSSLRRGHGDGGVPQGHTLVDPGRRVADPRRRMVKDLHVEGSLGNCRRVLEEMIAYIDHGLRLEEQGFAELIGGTKVDTEAITRRAYSGWYLTAEEAFRRGPVPVPCRKAVQCAYSALDREPCAAW